MIDTFNINDDSLRNQVFYYNGDNGWQVWNKPPNCNLVNFFLLGAGDRKVVEVRVFFWAPIQVYRFTLCNHSKSPRKRAF